MQCELHYARLSMLSVVSRKAAACSTFGVRAELAGCLWPPCRLDDPCRSPQATLVIGPLDYRTLTIMPWACSDGFGGAKLPRVYLAARLVPMAQ